MKLSQFADLLQSHPDKPFLLVLPGAHTVPVSFHITEVGHIAKTFIDCGGRLHTVQTCQLQAWVSASDAEHRLLAGKMAGVLELARAKGVLPSGEDLDIEIEYEDTVISQYTIANVSVMDGAVMFELAAKHTDCLAKDVCLPTPLTMATGCRGSSGCC